MLENMSNQTNNLLGRLIKCVLAALALGFCFTATAAESTGWRAITELGCHKADGTCFVGVDGAAVTGAASCVSTSIRWDAKVDSNGKNTLALLMMAKAQGKRVLFYVNGCYAGQPAFPTFDFVMIET